MLVETGLCRAKNAAHTSAMNLMIYPLGCLAFWAYGFAIGWRNWWNGPVPPGWYPSLGPGLAALNGGVGLGAATDAAGNLTGAYTYGLMAYAWFKLSNLITPIRVPRDVELEGLDSPEMGTLGYPDFQIHQEQRMAG
jgi:ammonia channel protein AmtB